MTWQDTLAICLQELPGHVSQQAASLLRDAVKLTVEDKDKKRALDQWCSIIVASFQLRQKAHPQKCSS